MSAGIQMCAGIHYPRCYMKYNSKNYRKLLAYSLMLICLITPTQSNADTLITHDQRGRFTYVPPTHQLHLLKDMPHNPPATFARFQIAKRKSVQNISNEPVQVTIYYRDWLRKETFILGPHGHRRLKNFNLVRKIKINNYSFGHCFAGDDIMRLTEDNLDPYATIAYYGEIDGPGHLSCHALPVLFE